jgi:hypothetical protein
MSLSEYMNATALIVKTSGFSCAQIDCLGRALAMDSAYQDLDAAKRMLMTTQKQYINAPHTDAADRAIRHIDQAENFLRNFTVSPDTVRLE